MNRYFIALPLDSLIGWWRLGELTLAKSQLFSLSSDIPLTHNDPNFAAILVYLPPVEHIRTLLIAEMSSEAANVIKQSAVNLVNIGAAINFFPLDARSESLQYIHGVTLTLPINQQSFLDLPLSLLCADSLQKVIIKNEKTNRRVGFNLLAVIKGYFMRKKSNRYYLPVLLESLVAWRRIGEAMIYEELLLKVPTASALPLEQTSELEQLKDVLPRFENIRNLVVIEIAPSVFEQPKLFPRSKKFRPEKPSDKLSRTVDYDDIQSVYPLDASEKSHSYLQSLVPSIDIKKQSFLSGNLSNKLIHWSEQRNAQLAAKKMLSLLGVTYSGSYLVGDLWDSVLQVIIMDDKPQDTDDSKLQSFLYALFFYSRNSMKSEFRNEDLGLIDDMAKILLDAISRDVIKDMGLDYRETLEMLKNNHRNSPLSLLITELTRQHKQIQNGLKTHFKSDVFIPALVFLKLKNMHLDQFEPDKFYEFITDLHATGCDNESLAEGVSWFAALYGFVDVQPLYNQLKSRAPFFDELQEAPVKVDIKNDQHFIQTRVINDKLIEPLTTKPQSSEVSDIDKRFFIGEGKDVCYAFVNQERQYQVNEGKGKRYKPVTESELREKINAVDEGQIQMKKESVKSLKPKKYQRVKIESLIP